MKKGQKGFSAIEGLLVLAIVGAVVFVGWYIYHVKHNPRTSLNKSSSASQADTTSTPVAASGTQQTPTISSSPGTTSSIDQLTQQDSQSESAINTKYESSDQSTVNNANSAQSNLGGAYNESTF